jgi:hypothetical protein
MAFSRGIFDKYIVVGTRWMLLPWQEQYAVLLHEAHHCLASHRLIRFLLLPVFWTKFAERIAQRQEMDADRFACEQGYAREMYRVAEMGGEDEFYPPKDERLANIRRHMKGVAYAIQ